MAIIYNYQHGVYEFKVSDDFTYDGADSYLSDISATSLYQVKTQTNYCQACLIDEIAQNTFTNNRMCFVLGNYLGGDFGTNDATLHLVGSQNGSQLDLLSNIKELYGAQQNQYPDPQTEGDYEPFFPYNPIAPIDSRAADIPNYLISTNIPIFKSTSIALDYINNGWDLFRMVDDCVNYQKPTELEETTKYYYISNQRGLADCVRNTATPTGAMAWQSMRFSANAQPVLYYKDDYSLGLKAPKVLASYAMTAPVNIIDNVPETLWVEHELMYTGLWYGTIMSRLEAKGETLPDGEYMYGFEFLTNIYIMPDEAAADRALEDNDFSEAVNYAEVSEGGAYNPPEFGDDEQQTSFGNGADTSPFMQTYILSRNALQQVAHAWYNTNPSTLGDILTGLKMFGDVPQECLAGITMYPFDVNIILNTVSQHYIYFGTYELQLGTEISKAMSLKSNAYLDCGTIFLASLQHSYKDFEPYTTLDVYLPYIGWQRMDISLLINKNVSVRYYVDIHTRACTACILANGVFVAQYSGNIGVGLPTCGADYQGYSNAMASTILGGASSVFSGAKGAQGAAMGAIGNIMSGAGVGLSIAGGVGGVAMGVASAAANTAATLNKLEAMGAPADHPQIKGGFTSCLGTYLPQSVLWRYIIHDTVEPNNFNALCGRPSSASGNVGSFSGFLSCKSVNLNTNHMLDAEAGEVYTLLKNGVYI